MQRVTITDGTNRSWTFPQLMLSKISRFYQDLSKETGTEPLELIIPNILAGIEPNFEHLEIVTAYLCQSYLHPPNYYTRSILNKLEVDFYTIMNTNNTWFENIMTLAKCLDMHELIASIIYYELCRQKPNDFAITCIITDQYIRTCCFESREPLHYVSLILTISNDKIINFIKEHRKEIIEAQKKFPDHDKHHVAIESYNHGYYLEVIHIDNHGLLPISIHSDAIEYIKLHPIVSLDMDDKMIIIKMSNRFHHYHYSPTILIDIKQDENGMLLYNHLNILSSQTSWSNEHLQGVPLFVPRSYCPSTCWITIENKQIIHA